MPRAFDIPQSSRTVVLDERRSTQRAFKVSNRLDRTVRARAEMVSEGQSKKEWATIRESPKDLAPGEETTFTAEVRIPADALPASYDFHLLVETEEDPSDLYDEGPTISFVVRKKPVWPRVAAACVVVALTVALVKLLGNARCEGRSSTTGVPQSSDVRTLGPGLRSRAGVPSGNLREPCQEGNCIEGLTCADDGVTGARLCLRPIGKKCSRAEECSSNWCQDGVCAPRLPGVREPCPAGRCGEGLSCLDDELSATKVCLRPVGKTCSLANECSSHLCQDGVCRSRLPGLRENCPAGRCLEGLSCVVDDVTNPKICLIAIGRTCSSSKECATHHCHDGLCGKVTPDNPPQRVSCQSTSAPGATGDWVEVVSVRPHTGTRLTRGQPIVFRMTIRYKLTSADQITLSVSLGQTRDGCNAPGSFFRDATGVTVSRGEHLLKMSVPWSGGGVDHQGYVTFHPSLWRLDKSGTVCSFGRVPGYCYPFGP